MVEREPLDVSGEVTPLSSRIHLRSTFACVWLSPVAPDSYVLLRYIEGTAFVVGHTGLGELVLGFVDGLSRHPEVANLAGIDPVAGGHELPLA